MRIKSIKIKGLYGYIDKQVKFHRDINLLVGINGSGKTSILNLINWMLDPNCLPYLCVTEFRKITLKITYKDVGYDLVCNKNSKKMTFHIKRQGAKNKQLPCLEIPLFFPDDITSRPDFRKTAIEQYSGMKPNKKEMPTYTLWKDMPKAIILGLDRNVARDSKNQKQNINVSSVDQVQLIANTNYSRYQNKLNLLNNDLRNKFMMSAFNVSHLEKDNIQESINVYDIQNKINEWRKNFVSYLSMSPVSNTTASQTLHNAALNYFEKIESLLRNSSSAVNSELSTEFKKLNDLMTDLLEFNKYSEDAYKPIGSYLDTINGFLNDSSKKLVFKSDTSHIRFQVLNKDGEKIGATKSVEFLSSGEQQLLTLFTFIKFNQSVIFIIDEPELSLHPKWQDSFLEAIKKIMPQDTQLILATHSPAIVGKNRSNCIVLLPYNN